MTTFATPVDTATFGDYAINRAADDPRPVYRFGGRITSDGPFTPDPGRYHLYSGLFCPWAQRSVLAIELAGITDQVGVSYVDNARDGRGWAFREANGPDPVNGFTLLRDAYEATEPGFDGHISVPTLWDTLTGVVVSNSFGLIDIDLSTRFGTPGTDLYPGDLAEQIDELDEWLRPTVNQGAHAALGTGEGSDEARRLLAATFAELDERLAERTYLLGDRLTLADVRLWVTLVRHDAGAAAAGAPRLGVHTHLWDYARHLYQLPAFTRTTDFASFGGTPEVRSEWSAPADRSSTSLADQEAS
jgi:glutathionyl-hydroquinone reductase